MKPFRIYADTSVIGGVHDPEFADESQQFIKGVRDGRFILMVSDIVIAELRGAPDPVRRILPSLPDEYIEPVEINEEVLTLRDAYLGGRYPRRALDGRCCPRSRRYRGTSRCYRLLELQTHRPA